MFSIISTATLLSFITPSKADTRVFVQGEENDCRYVDFSTNFGGPAGLAFPLDICYSFYIPDGAGNLIPSAIKAQCSTTTTSSSSSSSSSSSDSSDSSSEESAESTATIIFSDYSDADCDPLFLNKESTLSVGDSALGWILRLNLTLEDFNCQSENDDCSVVSQQQYFLGPCDPFGEKNNEPIYTGIVAGINGYCYAIPFAGISQKYDCAGETILFYDNLNCDDSNGILFENKFEDAAQCLAQGPSAQNGGFNESSIWTCAHGSGSSSDSSDSSSD